MYLPPSGPDTARRWRTWWPTTPSGTVWNPEFAAYIGADLEAVRTALSELAGRDPAGFGGGGIVVRVPVGALTVFAGGDSVSGIVNSLILSHEYFHVLQLHLSDGNLRGTPRWLVEGSAFFESMLNSGAGERYRDGAILLSANHDEGLSELKQFDLAEAPHAYGLGALASEWLAHRAGTTSQVSYWLALQGTRGPSQQARNAGPSLA